MANEKSLYPVFDIPTAQSENEDTGKVFKPCPLFDFDTGDFVLDGSGRVVMVDGNDAYILWVLKALGTQEGASLSYMDFGIDSEGALAEISRDAAESAFERTITETLMCHPCTERVYDFVFEWEPDNLHIEFTVKPRSWAAFDINMNVVE